MNFEDDETPSKRRKTNNDSLGNSPTVIPTVIDICMSDSDDSGIDEEIVSILTTNSDSTSTSNRSGNPHPVDQRKRKVANPQGSRHKRWVFTVNNYTDDAWQFISQLNNDSIGYMIVAQEVGEQGTPHLQGYIRFNVQKRLKTVQKDLGYISHGCWANLEAANKGDEANRKYCTIGTAEKPKNNQVFVECGIMQAAQTQGQGARNDFHEAFAIIKDGAFSETELEMAEKMPKIYLSHNKAVLRLRALHQRCLNPNGEKRYENGHEVIWIFGKTGMGKSYFVRQQLQGKNYFMKGEGKWWDFYEKQEYMWLDDFRKDWFKFSYLLKVLDRHPMPIEYKGGCTQLRVCHTYITCPVHPATLYGNKEDRTEQLIRRIYESGKILEANVPLAPQSWKTWTRDQSMDLLRQVENGEATAWGNQRQFASAFSGGHYTS